MKFFDGYSTETLANARRINIEWRFDHRFRRSSMDEFWFRLDQADAFHAAMKILREIDHTTGVPDDFDLTAGAALREKP